MSLMTVVVLFIIFIFGLIVYIRRPQWYFIYWMITYPILIPFLCFICAISTEEDTSTVIHHYSNSFMYLNLLILADTFFKNTEKKYNLNGVLFSVVLLCLYYLFHSFLVDGGLSYVYYNIKDVIVAFLPFLIIATNKKIRPDKDVLCRLFGGLLMLEFIGVLLNLSGIYFYRAYSPQLVQVSESNIPGTLFAAQSLGNIVSALYLYQCFYFFFRKEISIKQFSVVTLFAFFCLIYAGSRMCFVVSVLGVLLCVLLSFRRVRFPLILLSFIGYLFLNFLSHYNGGEISSNEGLNRIIVGLTSFTQAKGAGYDDESTVRLSEKVLDEYFSRSPWVGMGLSAQGSDFDAIDDNVSSVRSLMSDARLAFLLVDIGIIGVLLYFLYFFQIFRYISLKIRREERKSLFITFIFYLIFSITEAGLWDGHIVPYVFIYYFSIIGDKDIACKKIMINH